MMAFLILGRILVALAALSIAAQAQRPSTLDVDATRAPLSVLWAHIAIPASPGPLTLAYPEWIPGEHAPTGPLNQVVSLKFSANGKPLPWRRDDLHMFEFHLNVPPGVDRVEADLQFACLIGAEGFTAMVCSSQNQVVVDWHELLLYSPALPNDRNPFKATLRLPAGWRYGTALPVDREENGKISFNTVPLKTLVDSPVIAGQHFRVVPLSGARAAELDISAETEAALEIKPQQREHFTRLIAEAESLFGGPRYQHYHLLLSLGDSIDHYTLEHFESSENRLPDHGLLDGRILATSASLIPHEYVHSWNGKYRTPSGLDTATYQQPMKPALIWVYEGLTDYLGDMLAARANFWTPDQYRQALAISAAQMAIHPGRTWRPLQDTTVSAPLLYGAATAWSSARRGTDFYSESALIWLEADKIIRQQSHGRRSLDDFCKLFYGAQTAPTPYTFEDVVVAMNQIEPYDWRTFFRDRLDSTNAQPPLGGIEGSGWRFVYTAEKPQLLDWASETNKVDLLWPEWEKTKFLDLQYSIGLLLCEDGTVRDSVPEMAAFKAGIMPGMQVLTVNGAQFSLAAMQAAVEATSRGGLLNLIVANGNFKLARHVDYDEGAKYPRLTRNPSKPDLLSDIIAPRTRHPH